MSRLPKVGDEEKESKFGYVFAVSGPGKYRNFTSKVSRIGCKTYFLPYFSRYGGEDVRIRYVRVGSCRLL